MINNSHSHIVFSDHVSNQLKELLKKTNPIIKKINLPQLINIDYDKKSKFLIRDSISIIFFGRLLKYKGIELLLDSIISIQDKININLTIAGIGNIEKYQKKIDKIKNINIFNKWLSDKEIINLFDKNDLCILPYIEASQSGIVPISFMTGTPIIATDVGGLSEQIDHNYNGLLVRINIVNVADAIIKIYNNNMIYKKLSNGCYESFDQKYSFKNFSEEIKNYLKNY